MRAQQQCVDSVGFSTSYTRLDRISRSRDSVLRQDLTYTDRRGHRHTAKSGFLFDGGSIPRRLWRLFDDPYGAYLQAYVIHDWYCHRAKDLHGKDRWKLRLQADILFLEMLRVLGCPEAKARAMYAGVRIGACSGQLKRRK